MKDNSKPVLKGIVPPVLLDNIKFRPKYGWFGDLLLGRCAKRLR